MTNRVVVENMPVSQVIPYERNARKNDNAVKEVAKSIQRTGYRSPIIVDENNVILAGHTRYKAISKLGWKTIPFVVQYTDLDDAQKQEYRIRDNKTGEIAEWDFEILAADFTPEELIDFGFDTFGCAETMRDKSDKIGSSLKIEIDCENETFQQMVFDLLSNKGIKCRLLTL
jgi:hypothetical protein